MAVLDEIAAWFGISAAIAGYVIGLVLVILIVIAVSLVSDSPMLLLFVGLLCVIVLTLPGIAIFPLWIILPIILALAVMLLYGGNANASGANGRR